MSKSKQQQGELIVQNLLNSNTKVTIPLIKNALQEGNVDPAYLAVVLKKFMKIGEEFFTKDKNCKSILEEGVRLYQEGNTKTFEVHGAKVTIAGGGYWDYSKTEDPVLQSLKEIEKDVKAQIKLRQEELQAKALAWQSQNKPGDIVEFGLKPFSISYETIPVLKWEEASDFVETNPPVKIEKETFRFSV